MTTTAQGKAVSLAPSEARVVYERDGFVTVPGLIPRELIDRVSLRVEAVMRGEYETGRPPNGRNWNPGDSPHILRKIDQPNNSDRTILEMLKFPPLGQFAAALTGASRVKVFGVQLLYKPPGGQATANIGWHQDHQYWHDTYVDGGTLTAWVAVSDVTEASGPMKVVRGSHKWGLRKGGDFFGSNLEAQKAAMAAEGREWTEASAILPPGGVSFHHHLTIHGSGPNVSDSPRIGIAVHLMTDSSRFPAKCPPEFAAQIDDPIACPVIYQR